MQLTGGSVLNNESGGIVQMASTENLTQVITATGGGTINNLSGGLFQITSQTNTFVPFDNSAGATIEVDAGASFSLAGGGTDSGGTFNVYSGGLLDLTGGSSPIFTGTYTGSGTGEVVLQSGSIIVDDPGATFSFPDCFFYWKGGTLTDKCESALTNTGTIELAGTAVKAQLGITIINYGGTIEDSGIGSWAIGDGGVLNNVGGVINMMFTETFGLNPYSSAIGAQIGQVNNEQDGVLENTGPGGIDAVPLNNTGSVQVSSGNVTFSTVTQVSGSTLTGGSWLESGNGSLALGSGALTVNDAAVTLSGAGAFPQLNALATNAGTFSLLGGRSFTTAGNLNNTGTITVGPGSTLTATGTTGALGLTLGTNSNLNIQLGGVPATGLFGVVKVTTPGAIALAGNLHLALVNGYVPAAGDTFTVLTDPGHASTTFSGMVQGSSVSAGGRRSFAISYTGNGNSQVTLTAQAFLPTVTWVGGSTGSWDTASNWSTGLVPTLANDVAITTPGVTVTASGTDVANSITTGPSDVISVTGGSLTIWSTSVTSTLADGFNLSGGTLAFAGAVNVGGTSQWSAGVLEGQSINILSTATLTLTGSTTKFVSPFNPSTPALYAADDVGGNFDLISGSAVTTLSPAPSQIPYYLIFDKNGQILYTATAANQLRRYNPATGADSLVYSFPSGSSPTFMLLSPDGNSVLVSLQQANQIVQIDLNYTTGLGTLDPNIQLDTSPYGTGPGGLTYGLNGRLYAVLSTYAFGELDLTPTSLTVDTSNFGYGYNNLSSAAYDSVGNYLYTVDQSTYSSGSFVTPAVIYQLDDPNNVNGPYWYYYDTNIFPNPIGIAFDGYQTLYLTNSGPGSPPTTAQGALLSINSETFTTDPTASTVASVSGINDVLPLGGAARTRRNCR